MKFENGIEVSGIERVIIDRTEKKLWEKVRRSGCIEWQLHEMPAYKSLDDMATWIKLMVLSGKYRAWVHGDTINIVRRGK